MSLEVARRALIQEADAVRSLADRLDQNFVTAVEWIAASDGRVICCGVGKSGHIGRKTAGTLSSTGTPSLFLHAAEAVHGDLGMVTKDDVVLMFTHSGETDELVRLFAPLAAIGAKTILITGRPESSCGRAADLVLNTHVEREACPENLAPTTSTTVMLALSDALAIAVMTVRGFGREDFARFHPSGALGKRLLLRVRDVMRAGTDNAVVGPETPFIDVLREITQAGSGSASVAGANGELLGLITEGDIRRHIMREQAPLTSTAAAMMTGHPTVIEPDLLAVEALEVFQNLPKPIGEMPVVSEGKVVGILMLKDLLRSGIV